MGRGSVDTSGLDGLLADLDKMGAEMSGQVIDRALTVGGQMEVEFLRGALAQKIYPHSRKARSKLDDDLQWHDDLIDNGALLDSIKASKPKADKSNVKYVDVMPTGKDSQGKSNAEKAVHLEYGTRKIAATHFISDTVDETTDDITEAMADIIESAVAQFLGG